VCGVETLTDLITLLSVSRCLPIKIIIKILLTAITLKTQSSKIIKTIISINNPLIVFSQTLTPKKSAQTQKISIIVIKIYIKPIIYNLARTITKWRIKIIYLLPIRICLFNKIMI
jgi:hypothetical protein